MYYAEQTYKIHSLKFANENSRHLRFVRQLPIADHYQIRILHHVNVDEHLNRIQEIAKSKSLSRNEKINFIFLNS